MKTKITTNYNWENYNKNNVLLSKKLELFNNKFNINFIEKSYYNHTRDLFAISLIQKKKANVLDFGSNITALSNLKNKINIKNVTFYIYDPFYMGKIKKINSLKKIKVFICNSLIELRKIKFTLINFGSSLQYINKYENYIRLINFTKKSKILITATPITINKTYMSKQKNHKNLIQNIHNFSKLNSFFLKLGFRLIFKSAFNTKLSSVKKINKNTFFLNLLYTNEK